MTVFPATLPDRRTALLGLAAGAAVPLLAGAGAAADNADYVPKAGEFPPSGAGVYLAGELVEVDHVNRRGAIRLVGDNDENRYHSAPSHRFAMLPFGSLRYHGAPAELRDIPIGTLLHGTFLLPPAGDTTIPATKDKYVPRHSHALRLEDDISFYRQQARAWKLASVSLTYYVQGKKDWRALAVHAGTLTATATGKGADGLTGEQKLTVDRSTRLWRGNGLIEWEDLAAEAKWATKDNTRTLPLDLAGTQLNLTWAPDWKNGQFHVADVWLDEAAQKLAAERQRQVQVRHARHRWLAGWVDRVEHRAGGKGDVTLTLFGGIDPELLDLVRTQTKNAWAAVAAAEWTLRTWWQEHDHKSGSVLDLKEIPNPPPGSSGLQLTIRFNELLDGFRPGRIVRVRVNGMVNAKLPPEERINRLDDR
jgi:hypothetical protein